MRESSIVGVRLVGLASTMIGIGLFVSAVLIQALTSPPVTQFQTNRGTVHETRIFMPPTTMRYDLIIPGGVAVGTGIILIVMSRSFAKALTRGIQKEGDT